MPDPERPSAMVLMLSLGLAIEVCIGLALLALLVINEDLHEWIMPACLVVSAGVALTFRSVRRVTARRR